MSRSRLKKIRRILSDFITNKPENEEDERLRIEILRFLSASKSKFPLSADTKKDPILESEAKVLSRIYVFFGEVVSAYNQKMRESKPINKGFLPLLKSINDSEKIDGEVCARLSGNKNLLFQPAPEPKKTEEAQIHEKLKS